MSRRGVDGRTSRRRRTSTGRSEALISDVLVVSAAGPTSPAPGLTVLRALAEEPRAVVCDPTGPDVEASTLPPTLDLIDGYVSHWDATALLVCADTPEKERVMQAHPVRRRVAPSPAWAPPWSPHNARSPLPRDSSSTWPRPLWRLVRPAASSDQPSSDGT